MGRGSGGSRDGFCSRSREVGGGRRRRWMKTGGGERWRKWRGEGWLARVTCFKSLASLFNGLLGGKPGQGNVKLYFSAHCNYLAISPFLGLQYKLHVSPWSGNFSSVCISLEHRIILEGKHYLSSHVNTFFHTAALQTTPTHFPLSSHPMWLSFSWSHAAQRGASSVQCQRGLVGYTALRLSTSLPTRSLSGQLLYTGLTLRTSWQTDFSLTSK